MFKIWLIFLALLIVPMSGCIDENLENNTVNQTPVNITPVIPDPDQYTVFVSIKGSKFNPPELKVVNGTTVRWTNTDSAGHIINIDGVMSPPLNKRDMWNYTLNKTGTYEYNCSIHSSIPHGRIIVN